MAVSLVSTGVQFPDSSIQTTAASGGTFVYISTTTASGTQYVDITGFNSTYNTYIVECANLSVNTSIVFGARFFNSGTAYTGTYRSQAVAGGAAQKTAAYMEIGSLNMANLSGFSAPLRVQIQRNPSNSRSAIFSNVYYYTGADYVAEMSAGVVQASITVTGIRFFDAYGLASAISGTFILYGVKTS